jgi:hypothetical protein
MSRHLRGPTGSTGDDDDDDDEQRPGEPYEPPDEPCNESRDPEDVQVDPGGHYSSCQTNDSMTIRSSATTRDGRVHRHPRHARR